MRDVATAGAQNNQPFRGPMSQQPHQHQLQLQQHRESPEAKREKLFAHLLDFHAKNSSETSRSTYQTANKVIHVGEVVMLIEAAIDNEQPGLLTEEFSEN